MIDTSIESWMTRGGKCVRCICDICKKPYVQRTCRNTDACHKCRFAKRNKGNTHGKSNKGRRWTLWEGKNNPVHTQNHFGENHPNWNPNKKEYQAYINKVRHFTEANYNKHKDTINPHNHQRTLCGIPGGYQLDHIYSVKNGFEAGVSPEDISEPFNLQMLPWEENNAKRHK